MANAKRKQKLKVYRTPIGFHDAYVAAPSQKAALEAWGSDANIFARGSAEEVTDPDLMEVPLENPGQVVKVLRGTQAEQIAALAQADPRPASKSRSSRASKAEVQSKKGAKRPRKPSRSRLDRAEKTFETLQERHAKDSAALEKQEEALERKRKDMQRRHERERDRAKEELEEERTRYQSAMRRYEDA